MKRSQLMLAATLLLSASAFAETETHSVNYSYSLASDGDNYPRLTLPGFDTQNGQRTLTRVDVRVQTQVSASVAIENVTNAQLGDWTLTAEHTILTGFERANPEEFGPFAFLGGLSMEPVTGTLKPSDGTAGSGADYLLVSDSTQIDSLLDMDPGYHEFFSRGEFTAIIGPFTEFFLEGAELYDETLGTGAATVQFTDLAQQGSLSVIYHYSVVPEPSALAALAALGLIRRRR